MRTPLTDEQLAQMKERAERGYEANYHSETYGTAYCQQADDDVLKLVEEVETGRKVIGLYKGEYHDLIEATQQLIENSVINERAQIKHLLNAAIKASQHFKTEWFTDKGGMHLLRGELRLGNTCYVWTSDDESSGFLADLGALTQKLERFLHPNEEYAGFTFTKPAPSEPFRFFDSEARKAMERELP